MENNIIIALDLDETLIHASLYQLERKEDFRFENYYVYVRPYLREFLLICTEYFEIAIWSSASKEYVHGIISKIVPMFVNLRFVWSRPSYTDIKTGNMDIFRTPKILQRIIDNGLDPLNILVVDDNPDDSVCKFGNILEVIPFRGAPDDNELILLAAYLEKEKESENIRDIVKPLWRHNILKEGTSS